MNNQNMGERVPEKTTLRASMGSASQSGIRIWLEEKGKASQFVYGYKIVIRNRKRYEKRKIEREMRP